MSQREKKRERERKESNECNRNLITRKSTKREIEVKVMGIGTTQVGMLGTEGE
jgi:hypothetical protein